MRGRLRVVFVSALLLTAAVASIFVARDPLLRVADWSLVIARHELRREIRVPVTTWARRDPAEEGFAVDRLEAFRDAIGRYSSGCVIKDGALIFAWGEPDRNGEWGSATKPIFTTMLMFAIQEGLIDSADDSVQRFVSDLSEADRTMTLRQLANMTSGYTLPEAPGAAWAYNDYGTKLYYKALLEGVFGTLHTNAAAVQALLEGHHRFGPLEFEDGDLVTIWKDALRLNMSPRDYARVGVFWLNKGTWAGTRILADSLFDRYIRVGVPVDLQRTAGAPPDDYLRIGTTGASNDVYALGPGSYGFMLWFNDSRRLWPDVPEDAFQANGHNNREALTVIRSLGLVVAWHHGWKVAGNAHDFNGSMNDALKLLLEALPGQAGSK